MLCFCRCLHTRLCRLRRYHDGVELQLIDEEESPNHGQSASMYAAVTPATGVGTTAGEGGSAPNARFRTNAARNAPKYARVKALEAKDGGGGGGGINDATVLVIRRLTRFDSGRYECRVRNSVGAANSSNFANVRVQCECPRSKCVVPFRWAKTRRDYDVAVVKLKLIVGSGEGGGIKHRFSTIRVPLTLPSTSDLRGGERRVVF